MSKPCQDSYSINFTSFPLMLAYHEKMRQESRWERTEVNHLDRKSTRLNSSHNNQSRMPSSA